MNFRVTSTFNVDEILASRGLGPSNQAAKVLASIVKTYCDPYVPMEQGTLKNFTQIVDTGGDVYLIYNQPYAHYQYKGEVMAGCAPKYYTGVPIDYHGAPMRGKEWDKRMMADRSDDVATALAEAIGGKVK